MAHNIKYAIFRRAIGTTSVYNCTLHQLLYATITSTMLLLDLLYWHPPLDVLVIAGPPHSDPLQMQNAEQSFHPVFQLYIRIIHIY